LLSALIYVYVGIVVTLILLDVSLLLTRSRRKLRQPDTAVSTEIAEVPIEDKPGESESEEPEQAAVSIDDLDEMLQEAADVTADTEVAADDDEMLQEAAEVTAGDDEDVAEVLPEESDEVEELEQAAVSIDDLDEMLQEAAEVTADTEVAADDGEMLQEAAEEVVAEEVLTETESGKSKEADRRELESHLVFEITQRLEDRDSAIRLTAIQEAAHFLNETPVLESLIQCLEDESSQVREIAASTLEYSDDDRVIEPLIKYLNRLDDALLEESQRVLKIRPKEVGKRVLRNAEEDEFRRWPVAIWDDDLDISPLTRILQDRNVDFRGRAEDLEGEEALEIAPELREIVSDEALAENVRSLAVYALGRIQDGSSVDSLCSIMSSAPPSLKYTSALALAEIGDERAVDTLLKYLRDENRFVRSSVAYALGKLGSGEVVESLVGSLNDSDDGVRHTLWKSLQEIRVNEPQVVKKALENALKEPDDDTRRYTAEAIGKLGDREFVPLLKSLLEAETEAESELSLAVAGALVELEDLEAITHLVEASRKLDSEFKEAIQKMKTVPGGVPRHTDLIKTINKDLAEKNFTPSHLASAETTAGYYATLSAGKEIEYIREALKNNSMFVRGCAVYQLEEINSPEAVELLLMALSDRSSYVRGAAAEVVGLRSEQQAIGRLMKMAREEQVKDVRLKAIKAVGRLNDGTVKVHLEKLLEEKDADIVRYARQAIRKLA